MTDASAPFDCFDSFYARYRRQVRPEGTLERLTRAFEIGVEFQETFKLLRPYLRRFETEWAELIVDHVTRAKSATEAFDPQHRAAFAYIYGRHARSLYAGQFDAAYLASVEKVALYMAYRDIKSVWLAGAYQAVFERMIGFVFARTETHRRKKLETAIQVLAKAIAIETNQVQRVFTALETERLRAATDALPPAERADALWAPRRAPAPADPF